jgi:hypothetical protein
MASSQAGTFPVFSCTAFLTVPQQRPLRATQPRQNPGSLLPAVMTEKQTHEPASPGWPSLRSTELFVAPQSLLLSELPGALEKGMQKIGYFWGPGFSLYTPKCIHFGHTVG